MVVDVNAGRGPADRSDFYISYAYRDRAWAEWIAWQLEHADSGAYSVELAAWDWPAGTNWVLAMTSALTRSDRVVALYSQAYFDPAQPTAHEWSDALFAGEDGQQRLLPVRIEAVEPPPVLRSRTSVDLFGIDHGQASRRLLDAARGPSRPDGEPVFPPRGAAHVAAPTAEPRLPGSQPEIWNIPAAQRDFVGRDRLLVDLRESLLAGGPGAIQAIYGMGGVGKTQLAIEYAHRYAGDYDLAWWVDVEQEELFAEKLGELTELLRSSSTSVRPLVAGADGKVGVAVRWLLVLDNAADSDVVTRWQLTGGSGHVLVTSRNPHWHGVGSRLEVDPLGRREAVALIQSRATRMSDADADRLADALGDLPLALAQAAAFLDESGMTPDEYLTELASRAREILSEGRLASYPRSLAASWLISMEKLAKEDSAAVDLLDVAAFFAPEPVPFDLLRAAPEAFPGRLVTVVLDTLAFHRTTSRIGRYSLARIDQGTLQLHRIIQALIRDRLSRDESSRARWNVHAILVAARLGNPVDPASWEDYRRLLPHLLAADLSASENPRCRDLLLDTVCYLTQRGETAVAHRLAREAVDRWMATAPPDDAHRLAASTALAHTLTGLGRYDEALAVDTDVHTRLRDRLGADHPATLAAASDVAADLNRLGRFADARDLDEETMRRRVVTLGRQHPDTLTSMNNLAADLWRLGRYDDARLLDEETLAGRREVLEPDHPDTLASRSNLASDLRGLGRHEEARRHDDEVLTRRLDLLGPDHPDSLLSANNLAIDLTSLGKYNDAKDLHEKTVAGYRRVLGSHHPDTLGAIENLADQLNYLGEHDRARDLDEETLLGRREVFGEDHPETLRAADNVAGDLRRVGRFEEAHALDQQTLLHRRRVLGEDHPDTALSAKLVDLDQTLISGNAQPRSEDLR
jgi:hypothetical protein